MRRESKEAFHPLTLFTIEFMSFFKWLLRSRNWFSISAFVTFSGFILNWKKERITFNCLCFFIYAWESDLCSYFKKWFYQASFDVMSKSIGSLFYVSIDAHKRIMCTVKSRLFGSFSFSFFKKGSFWITHLLKKKSDQCKREIVKKKKSLRSEGCEKIMLISSIKRLGKEKLSSGLPMIFATDFSHQSAFISYNRTLYESPFRPRRFTFARGNHKRFVYPHYSIGSFAFSLKSPFPSCDLQLF